MRYLPIFLDKTAGLVMLVGSSHGALNKLKLLREAGVDLRWFPVQPDVAEQIALFGSGGSRFEVSLSDPLSADLSDVIAVIAATDYKLEERLASRVRERGIPMNVVDRPDLSTFIFPAVIDRGEVVVAVGTGGSSPVLARRVRERIESILPARIGDLSALIGRYRSRLVAAKSKISPRLFWERVIDGPIGALVLAGHEREAEKQLIATIAAHTTLANDNGTVFLVGAGPGDPDLLTLRALHVLADADVVFYDDLVSPLVLDRARRDAERIFVGKRQGQPGVPQDEINRLLQDAAARGKRVVRLKGGDPFVFGRGGEELSYLRNAGIPVIVIPGVTAALGCAAEAGLPLTLRQAATQLTFVTAHQSDGASPIDWTRHADDRTTLAVYMGLQSAAAVRDGLLAAGRSPQTPVAVLARGTLPDAQNVIGVLNDLPVLASTIVAGPALLIIGEVVAHSNLWHARAAALELDAQEAA